MRLSPGGNFGSVEWLRTVELLMMNASKSIPEARKVDMSTITTSTTPEDLLKLPDAERFELVDGELVENPAMGGQAGWIAGRIVIALHEYEKSHGGWVFPDGVGYQCYAEDPNRVRRPDVSYIAAGRLPNDEIPEGHIRTVPDVVVEVVSPRDVYGDVETKVEEYLRAGVRLVWVFGSATRRVWIYPGSDRRAYSLTADDDLTGDDVLPKFSYPIANFFPNSQQSA